METEDGNDSINTHILTRTTAEQEKTTRWVRCALALVGVSFSNSAWYVYALQVVGLGAQGWSLYVLISDEDYWATDHDRFDYWATPHAYDDDATWQTNILLLIFIQVFPWCFLCYLTRSYERHILNDIVKNLTMPWWMYVLPFVANLAICVEVVSITKIFWFVFLFFFTLLPASIAILLMFAYVVEFEKQLPIIQSIEDIKEKVLRYQIDIKDKIFKINVGLILPNVIFWVFLTLDRFWFVVECIERKDYYCAVYNSLFTYSNFFFALTFLLPPVYHTYVMNKFVSTLDETYCEEDTGVLGWLSRKQLGWKVFSVEMLPQLLKRIMFVMGGALLTGLAKVLE